MKRTALVVAAAALGLGLIYTQADAHYPEIDASFDCRNNVVHAQIRSRSWVTGEDERRYNDRIEISWDGKVIGTGAFTAENEYSFAVLYDTAPDGRTHTVTATAAAAFGRDQQFGFAGTSRQTTLTLPDSCAPPTTATTSTTTTTAPTPTTLAPTTTAATQVLGEVVTLPPAQPAIPVAVQPQFTG